MKRFAFPSVWLQPKRRECIFVMALLLVNGEQLWKNGKERIYELEILQCKRSHDWRPVDFLVKGINQRSPTPILRQSEWRSAANVVIGTEGAV